RALERQVGRDDELRAPAAAVLELPAGRGRKRRRSRAARAAEGGRDDGERREAAYKCGNHYPFLHIPSLRDTRVVLSSGSSAPLRVHFNRAAPWRPVSRPGRVVA